MCPTGRVQGVIRVRAPPYAYHAYIYIACIRVHALYSWLLQIGWFTRHAEGFLLDGLAARLKGTGVRELQLQGHSACNVVHA